MSSHLSIAASHKMSSVGDDSESSTSTASIDDTSSNPSAIKKRKKLNSKKQEETEGKTIWRTVLVAFLLAMAGFSYVLGLTVSDQAVTLVYDHTVEEVSQWAKEVISDIRLDLRTLSIHATSVGITGAFKWPYYVQNDFEMFIQDVLEASNAQLIGFAPVIEPDCMDQWENFSVKYQGWVQQGYLEHEGDHHEGDIVDPDHFQIPSKVFREGQFGDRVREYGPGPYLPLWQFSNAHRNPSQVNYNLLSNPTFARMFHYLNKTKEPVLTDAIDDAVIFGETTIEEERVGRRSLILEPVFDAFDSSNPNLVGIMFAAVPWETLLSNRLHQLDEDGRGVVCVFRDSCGQTFTYKIDGNEAVYVGEGDLHDFKYDSMERVLGFGPNINFRNSSLTDNRLLKSDSGECSYTLHLYPSPEFYKEHNTKNTGLLAVLLTIFFGLACVGVTLYDRVAQWRERKLEQTNARSKAIISSLFPDGVRDQLMYDANDDKDARYEIGQAAARKNVGDILDHVNNGDTVLTRDDSQVTANSDGIFEGKPIASFFPETTVMFADIAGFTAWSSEREPEQVFQLLESIYSGFDKIARRRHVFKVETIGDCYIAVAGLPDPQPTHAVIMARFARDCMIRMNRLVRDLEGVLGPDTGDLVMRFGLHSGPVTAGVLRGQRARFQLYGDTVNIASKMENTGERNRIQISQETADLLVAAGKSSWIRKRQDKPIPLRETFWLLPRHQKNESVSSGNTNSLKDTTTDVSYEDAISDNDDDQENVDQLKNLSPEEARLVDEKQKNIEARKLDRLVFWNVEVLSKQLKLIVANRKAIGKAPTAKATMAQCERDILGESDALSEIKEFIKFPKFNERAAKKRVNLDSIELKPGVEAQLREYVLAVQQRYRHNPFHNFEHASHVVMSTGKLLSRIVMNEVENDKNLHDCTFGISSDPLAQFAVTFCALIHDVDHRGVPNFQLVQDKKKLAIRYKNKSVLEQNSIDVAWSLLMEDRFSDLRRCIYTDESEFMRFRQLTVNTLMATDIFDKDMNSARNDKWDKAFSRCSTRDTSDESSSRKATIIFEYLVQASDIAHTMQHWHIFEKWNEKLFEEMAKAFYVGKIRKNPAEGWFQGEIAFFDNYVIPLAEKLSQCGVFGVSSDEYLQYAYTNRDEWKKKGQEKVVELTEKYRQKFAVNGVALAGLNSECTSTTTSSSH